MKHSSNQCDHCSCKTAKGKACCYCHSPADDELRLKEYLDKHFKKKQEKEENE
jgi:hypothetical protein